MADLTKVSHAADAYIRALDAAIEVQTRELKAMVEARNAAKAQINPAPPAIAPRLPEGQGGDPIAAARAVDRNGG